MSNEAAILEELKTQSGEIKELSASVNALAKAIAEKAIHDDYLKGEVSDLKEDVEQLTEKVTNLELAAAGDAAFAEIKGWFFKAIVTAAGIGAVSGIVWLIVQIKSAS